MDQRGVPFSFLKNVVSITEDKKSEKRQELKGEPYRISKEGKKGRIELRFYGYYGEPEIKLNFDTLREGKMMLEYDPKIGQWIKRDWTGEEEKK